MVREARKFLGALATSKARSAPVLLQPSVLAAWHHRWRSLLACTAARSFAEFLVDKDCVWSGWGRSVHAGSVARLPPFVVCCRADLSPPSTPEKDLGPILGCWPKFGHISLTLARFFGSWPRTSWPSISPPPSPLLLASLSRHFFFLTEVCGGIGLHPEKVAEERRRHWKIRRLLVIFPSSAG